LGTSDVTVQVRYPSTSQNRCLLSDYYYEGDEGVGFDVIQCEANQCKIRIYRYPIGNAGATLTCDILVQPANNASGAGISSFQWSTSEQVWPFEKASDGSTLYCKEISLGAMPNAGSKNVAHSITGLAASDVFSFTGFAYDENYEGNILVQQLPWPAAGNEPYEIQFYLYGANIVIYCASNISASSGVARIIYKK
jgi:hypothetical protein